MINSIIGESFKNYVTNNYNNTLYYKAFKLVKQRYFLMMEIVENDNEVKITDRTERIEVIIDQHFHFDHDNNKQLKLPNNDARLITIGEIKENIRNMKLKKATGPDGIPLQVLSELLWIDIKKSV